MQSIQQLERAPHLTRLCATALAKLAPVLPRAALLGPALLAIAAWAGVAQAQAPDHPVITEVFQDVPGNDGPVGRLPENLHQEFIELYIPTATALAAGLNKDALNLTFYEVEGDNESTGLGRPNYRIDLPTLDLDSSNGLTPGAWERPPSGVIVLGWVDYTNSDPPTGLAGTPASRLGLIRGGITSATDFMFVAINGAQFDGTTNFPVPSAVSPFDPTFPPNAATGLSYASRGEIEQGSAAYLLVNRDDPGYGELCAPSDPRPCNSSLFLPSQLGLQTSCLLDAFASNDDGKFDPLDQPTPAGDGIDLDFVLPLSGAFSQLVPQLPEVLHGHARSFLDLAKTTEDAVAGNDDPISDWLRYRTIANAGAVEPTPGVVHFTTSPSELQLGASSAQVFEVLTNTLARPAIIAANIGGNFGMNVATTPGVSTNPAWITFGGAASSFGPVGQAPIFPSLVVQTFATTPAGHTEVVDVQVVATASGVGDPSPLNASGTVAATFRAIDPTTGLDANGQPFQATALLAIQGIRDQVGVANEFLGTSLGQHVVANLGGAVLDDRGKGALLTNPTTNLADPLLITSVVGELPDEPLNFIDAPGPPGKKSLLQTVLGSAEVLIGKTTYENSFNLAGTLLQAREFTISETPTSGSAFVPTEGVYYVDATGQPGVPGSGLNDVRTGRGFEFAILDTNLGPTGFVETGASDDFGIIVKVGQTQPGSPVVPGEFVFLSFSGGLEGADVDTLDVPPFGSLLNIIYLDLDPLSTVLGVETVTSLFIVDGSGGGEVDPLEVFSLIGGVTCGDGIAEGAELCDEGVANGTASSCCTSECTPRPAGTVCNPGSGDLCDPDEVCTGAAGAVCPADTIAPASTICRAGSGDLCDPAESCSGTAGAACPVDAVAPAATLCRSGSGDACDPDESCTGLAGAACPADAFASAGTTCRSGSGDVCDPDESCTGFAGAACPADVFAPTTTECRATAGACDIAESCTGSAAACPVDDFAPAATECRGSAGVCDVAESCTGSTAACPADLFRSATAECRSAAGVCDAAESCTGFAAACPADGFEPAVTECRGAAGACDAPEACTGSDAACPADVFEAAATECRAVADVCDVAESCTGLDVACPADVFEPAATECRGALGGCDVAESCTGSAAACPVDGFAPAAAECRGSAGVCDRAESCTGSAGACPVDGFESTATVCRTAAGVCDAAESCTGSAAACPADAFEPAVTECRGAAGVCDAPETCTGSDVTCPADVLLPATSECRAAADVCDRAESCTGFAVACPADLFEPAATDCRRVAGVCDTAETCTGAGPTCPIDAFESAASECRGSNGDCDVAESCTGSAAACPADVFESPETVCRSAAGICDATESCTGAAPACPEDVFEPAATECRSPAAACDAAETCTGSGVACPMDSFEPAGTLCRSVAGACDVAESCTGVTADCPADEIASVGSLCRAAAGDCDRAEACDGAAATCPTDDFAARDTACSSGDECLMDQLCDGTGLCLGGRLSVPAPDTCPVIDTSLFFAGPARDVVVAGDLVYVAASSAGLRIVDFSDPTSPVEVSSYDPPTCLDAGVPVAFVAEDVVLSDNFLFVSAGACGILIFDTAVASEIHDGTVPIAIDTDGLAFGVATEGLEAYAADADGGIAVLDLLSEAQTESYGAGDAAFGTAEDIELHGDHLIVATGPGLRIVEETPGQGYGILASYDSGNEATGASRDVELVRAGGRDLVYLAREFDGLDVLDISDPSQVSLLKNMPSLAGTYEVSISGARAVTAEGDGGIGVLDLSDPSAPTSLGTHPSEGFTADVEMNDAFAFVAFETADGAEGGLRIVQLERIGVDPTLVPEPHALFGSLIALATVSAVGLHCRSKRRRSKRG